MNAVNARELWGKLDVKTRFNDWIANRIEKYDFVENQDFITLTENLVSGGKQTNYFISLDMAKELSMVENNAQGKIARRYFIECEKKMNGIMNPTFRLRNSIKNSKKHASWHLIAVIQTVNSSHSSVSRGLLKK